MTVELAKEKAEEAIDIGDLVGADLLEDIFNLRNRAEDIAQNRGLELDVDDDNNPAPKNIPTPDLIAMPDQNQQ